MSSLEVLKPEQSSSVAKRVDFPTLAVDAQQYFKSFLDKVPDLNNLIVANRGI
ncbi:MAG: hypothetical protein K0M45_08855 [Candidatus Paracaedibacteraceae bacterium]|nr:hypothetical protein [Candidatus Paracaedibacteraceae bacterium]